MSRLRTMLLIALTASSHHLSYASLNFTTSQQTKITPALMFINHAFYAPDQWKALILTKFACHDDVCGAVGVKLRFSEGTTDMRALSYSSIDHGKTWSNPIFLSNPGPHSIVTDLSCVDNHCAAVGSYFNNYFYDELPLTYTSQDGGVTWSDPLLPPLKANAKGYVNSVSCAGKNCVTVGLYYDDVFKTYPLIYTSANNGSSWSQPITLDLPNKSNGDLSHVSCYDKMCFAVGRYQSRDQFYRPIGFKSLNSGLTWSNVKLMPFNKNENEELGDVSITCYDNQFCHFIVNYLERKYNEVHSAISYTTQNGGITWSQPSHFALPENAAGINIRDAKCYGTHCISVGYYTEIKYTYKVHPLLYFSKDKGSTWSKPYEISLKSIPNQIGGRLLQIECHDQSCMVSGTYQLADGEFGIKEYPFTMTSTDDGMNWSDPVLLPRT